MRPAIWSNVRGSIRPCAAYGVTNSRICPASARTARRTIVRGIADSVDLVFGEAVDGIGKLCTRNVYINIPRSASSAYRARWPSAAVDQWLAQTVGVPLLSE